VTEIQVDDEIFLRPVNLDDEEVYFKWLEANRGHLARWLPFAATAQSRDDVKVWLEQRTSNEEAASRIGGFVFYRDEFVGTANLKGVGSPDNAGELGYALSEGAQGKGIIIRACRTIIDIAFAEKEIHRVMVRGARGNQRSRAIPERLGFTFEGFQREAAYLQGEYHDLAVYSLLAQEWDDAPKRS
jgi:ribosomal-protein-serine acetyltransferase